MSIKNQLRAAILSGGAIGNRLSREAIRIELGGEENDMFSYVAPWDGEAMVFFQDVNANAKVVNLEVRNYRHCANVFDGSTWIRVSKGETVYLTGLRLLKQSPAQLYFNFIKVVGGGKNPVAQLIWRAVPCLRSIYDQCLSRTVDRIRACLRKMSLTFIESYRVTEKYTSFIQLRQTVGLCYRLRTVPYLSHYESGALTLRILRLLTRGVQRISRSLREKKFPSLLTTAQSKQKRFTCTFSNTLARNLCFGGASHA